MAGCLLTNLDKTKGEGLIAKEKTDKLNKKCYDAM